MKDIWKFGAGGPYLGDYKIHETLVASTIALWVDTNTATLSVSTTGGLADAMGMVVAAAQDKTLTLSTVQGETEGIATIIYNPFQIYEVRVNPGATSGTAYANGDGYLLTEDSGETNGLVITDAQVGGSTNEPNNGLVFGLTGSNVGESRNITATSANVSLTVVNPFPNDILVGDTFVHSQYAPGVIGLQLTTDLVEADGGAAGAAGGDARIVAVRIDTSQKGTPASPQLYLEMVLLDHAHNSFTN